MSSPNSNFEATASSLSLSEKSKEQAWAQLRKLGVGNDDPEAARVLLHFQAMEDVERIKNATAEILAQAQSTITKAASETAENIERAAAKVEKASAAKMAAHQGELVTKVSESIAASADRALTQKVATQKRNSLASWIAAAVIMIFIACGAGFYLGQSHEAANAARVSALFTREDGSMLIALAEANNFKATIGAYCQTGSTNVHRVQGGVYCQAPLWLQHDGVVSPVPGGIADPTGLGASVSAYLISWGPWWLLGAGAILFLLLRFLVNLATEIEFIRYLLVLPIRETASQTE